MLKAREHISHKLQITSENLLQNLESNVDYLPRLLFSTPSPYRGEEGKFYQGQLDPLP
jgi:hypothetical protein